MCASSSRIEQGAVFVDTNLGTNLVVSVYPDTHVGDFKREFELQHLKCFPDRHEIRVCGLMLKQRTFFYHLPESMLIKHAFQGKKGTWFLHVEAKTLNGTDTQGESEPTAAEVENHTSNAVNGPGKPCLAKPEVAEDGKHNSSGTVSFKSPELKQFGTNNERNKRCDKGKKPKKEKNRSLKHHLTNNDRNRASVGLIANEKPASKNESSDPLLSEVSSQIVSVTGIIKRYFSSPMNGSRDSSPPCSDATTQSRQEDQIKCKVLDSCSPVSNDVACTQPKANLTPRAMTLSSPLLNLGKAKACTGKLQNIDVGKRLVIASSNIRMAGSKQRLLSSLQGFKDEKSRGDKSSSVARTIVFDISDSE